MYESGMLLWLWIFLAPAIAVAFSGAIGGPSRDDDLTYRTDNTRRM